MTRTINVIVNGRAVKADVQPRVLLADFIRDQAALTGTHLGCEHGVCGACTVQLDGRPVRSCLMFAVQAHERQVMTVESLARDGQALHPLQQAFHQHHALQCGFCTPGILMTMEAFLRAVPDPSAEQVRDALAGNLCRCTGYQNIITAVLAAGATMRALHAPDQRADPRLQTSDGPD